MKSLQTPARCVAALFVVVCAAEIASAGWWTRRARPTQVRYVAVQTAQQPAAPAAPSLPAKTETAKPQLPMQAQIPSTAQFPVATQAPAGSRPTYVSTRPTVAPNRYGRAVVNFDNRSGQPALVRLVGPTRAEVRVSSGGRNSIHRVAGGLYTIRVRYGEPGAYRHTEGQSFQVVSASNGHSVIAITLHRVVNGNYRTQPISAAEFDAAAP